VRGANFTINEDKALCNAWKPNGLDVISKNEQQRKTYRAHIHGRSTSSVANIGHTFLSIIIFKLYLWIVSNGQVAWLKLIISI
jgi:hypothetical protein